MRPKSLTVPLEQQLCPPPSAFYGLPLALPASTIKHEDVHVEQAAQAIAAVVAYICQEQEDEQHDGWVGIAKKSILQYAEYLHPDHPLFGADPVRVCELGLRYLLEGELLRVESHRDEHRVMRDFYIPTPALIAAIMEYRVS